MYSILFHLMKNKYCFLVGVCLFIVGLHGTYAQSNSIDEQKIILLDQYYRTANYKYGLTRVKEFSRTFAKKYDQKSPFHVCLKSYAALYHASLSDVKRYQAELNEAEKQFAQVDKTNRVAYTLAVNALSEAYAVIGNHLQAEEVYKIAFAQQDLIASKAYNPYRLELVLGKLNVDNKQGYFNKTQEACKTAVDEAFARIVSYDSIPNKKGEMNYVKLKKNDLNLRQKQYAALVLLKAELYLENGFYDSALVELNQIEPWIKKNLKYKNGLLAQAYFLKAQLATDRDDLKEADKLLLNASGAALNYYKQHAPQVVAIQKKYIYNLIDLNRREEATIRNNDLDVKVLSYYGKNSLAYEDDKLIDVEREVRNNEWGKVARHLEGYLSKKDLLPDDCKDRADALFVISEAYLNLNQLDKAEASMNEAVAIVEKINGKNAPVYHLALLRRAAFYTEYSEKFKEAEEVYNYSFDQVITNEMSHYSSYYNAHKYGEARLMEVVENYKKAGTLYDDIEKDALNKYGTSSIGYAVALSKNADFQITLGNYVEADQKLKVALSIADKNTQQKHYIDQAHVLQIQGRFLIVQGLYDEANTVFQKVRRLLKKSFETEEHMYASLEELYLLNIYMGKYQETERSLGNLITLRQERFGNNHKSLINPLCYLAYLKIVTGNYAEAEVFLDQAQSISTKLFGEQSVKYAEVLVYKKMFYTAIGDYAQAEKAIKKVVDVLIDHFGINHIKVAKYMHELALAKYYSLSDDQKPLLSNASVDGAKGDSRGLETTAQKPKKTAAKTTENKKPGFGTHSSSEDLFNKSLEILKLELGENNPAYATALENAAIYYMHNGKYEVAIDYIKKSRAIWQATLGDKNVYAARVEYLTGNILFLQAKYSEALVALEKSKGMFSDLFDEKHPEYLEAQGKCAQLYYVLGDVKKSVEASEETIDNSLLYLDQIFPTLSERGKASYWSKVKNNFEFYKNLAFTQHATYPDMIGKVYDITLKTKAILLSSSLKIKQRIQSSGDSIMIKNYDEWIALKEELGVAVSMSAAQRKSSGIDIEKLEVQIESYGKKLSKSSDLFAKNFSNKSSYDWKTLKKSLNKNEVALEVVPFRYFDKKFTDTVWYAVLAVDNDTKDNPSFVLMKEGLHMNTKAMNYYRNCIKYQISDERSYTTYWLPIKSLIKNDNMLVYFSADGVYNQLNVETIKTPEGQFLLTQNNIVLISSTREIIERKNQPSKNNAKGQSINNIVLLGNPSYYSEMKSNHLIPQLPGAEKEVKQLDSLLLASGRKVNMYLGEQATEGQLKKTYNPGVFHIATHGFFLEAESAEGLDDISDKAVENPLLRSGLLLKNGGQLLQNEKVYAFNKEDGILTAYEAMNLNFDQTELVVLSACETGLGEVQMGEGVFGLQRSFLVAGSKSVVMSLFKVSDKVTAELMSSFYQKWIDSGNKRTSFIQAKIEIMNKYNNPHYWGAFIMMGIE